MATRVLSARAEAVNAAPRYGHDRSWYDWPYCIERQPDGTWLALNRDYRALGERAGWCVYETHPARTPLPGLTRRVVRQISIEPIGAAIPDRIYLYSDATSPRRSPEHRAAYKKKLALLLDAGLPLSERRPCARAVTPEQIREAARKRPRSRRAWPMWKEVAE
ncbi:hypothetical protein [Terricaulis silvestris]|uniref:Uncharacterized protein n=1 Tax=Terricaulis silvestris TaxID=2686094 RepID=A0A6I6MJN1_9CAUL|nr:hypothetical protein [Terricaulis silvestris]QGZ94879.1 hypothetical protein DSM104635_01712 [Terricaulis silvestris]